MAVLSPLAFVSAAQAASLTWPTSLQSTAEITPQSGADPDPFTAPGGTACWSATNCVSVGTDDVPADVVNNAQQYSAAPIVVPITAGQPGPAVQVALPSGAASYASGHQNDVTVYAADCQAASGFCVAVGAYTDSYGLFQPMFIPIENGVAGQAVEVSLPTGASTIQPYAALTSVSCPASGPCLAAGVYQDSSSDTHAFDVSISNGVPGNSYEVPIPGGAQFDAGFNNYAIGPEVACWSAGDCVLAGQYLDTNYNDVEFISSVTGGVPAAASALTLPSDAHAADSNSDQVAQFDAVGCAASGACLAVGQYSTNGGTQGSAYAPLVVAINNGQPVEPTAVTLPSDAFSDTSPDEQTDLGAVACPASGPCVAVGSYTATSFGTEPLIVEVSATGASTAIEPGLPSGAEPSASQSSSLQAVACPVAGSCLAAGQYNVATTTPAVVSQPFSVAISAGQAQTPQEQALPSGASGVQSTAPIFILIGCTSSGSCAMTGDYVTVNPVVNQGFVDSLQVPLSVSTTSLPAGSVGSAYSQTLAATGAWGTYSWSVSSGSLPAGLSLNAQTGVISGTPTAGSSGSFTVKVTGTGVPAQTATESLSISVPTPVSSSTLVTPQLVPLVRLRVAGSRLLDKAGLHGLTVLCSAAACSGSVSVLYTYTPVGKHRKVTAVIGSGSFAVAAGGSRALALHLSSVGRRLLLASRHLRLSVLLRATVAGGSSVSTHATLRYVTPKRK